MISVSQARKNLYKLIDEVATDHTPAFIKGRRNGAVLVSQEDWNNIQETLYILSIPSMRESLIEADEEPLDECGETLEW